MALADVIRVSLRCVQFILVKARSISWKFNILNFFIELRRYGLYQPEIPYLLRLKGNIFLRDEH